MIDIKLASRTGIVDITKIGEYEDYLQRCLAGPFRRYKKRTEYLKKAIPKGFHKKLLIFNGEVVGQIEYSPAEVSYYPIMGDSIIVMNCIWVLKKAKGHNFGKLLLEDMIKSEKDASGFATIALENHWSPWFKKCEIDKLGFKSLNSIKATHKTKYKGKIFSIYLMWMPATENAKPPSWNQQKLLEGLTSALHIHSTILKHMNKSKFSKNTRRLVAMSPANSLFSSKQIQRTAHAHILLFRVVKEIDLVGQVLTHTPHPKHLASSNTNSPFSR